MLCEPQWVCVHLPAQLAHELAERAAAAASRAAVLSSSRGQLRSAGGLLVHQRVYDFQPENRRRGDVILKVQFPNSFGFLIGRLAFALAFGGGLQSLGAMVVGP